ncbi:MAG: radical SAM protein [Chloroflexi bacterium]|nr:radical SAM protein [Chloroflexota bacterium]
MLDLSRLMLGQSSWADDLRYGKDERGTPAPHWKKRKPVVVWNCTIQCNLDCAHCYIDAKKEPDPAELTTAEARAMIDDLAGFKVPALIFSGGEPLMRPDIFELTNYAARKGLRVIVSSNGTLISRQTARRLDDFGVNYIGISIDGLPRTHDRLRGRPGAFAKALKGIRNCLAERLKVGIRYTLTANNFQDLEPVLDKIVQEGVPRVCIYHLVYSGRANELMDQDLTKAESRFAVKQLFKLLKQYNEAGMSLELLTVDNHCDGVLLYQELMKEDAVKAYEVYDLLRWNGGNQSGVAIGCIGNTGEVHADQFWRHYSFGNIRNRKFSEIWMDTSDPVMAGLKDRKELLKGRCGKCQYLEICNGNMRVRAEAVTGDIWAPDPACYMKDTEIGIV